MDAFRAGEVAEHLGEFRIVVGLHLIGQHLVAVDRVDLDLIGDRQQIVEVRYLGRCRLLAHCSKSFSSSARSKPLSPAAG